MDSPKLLQTKGCATIMTVETPERDWTDSRIDDVRKKVGRRVQRVYERFEKVDDTFRELRGEMKAGFARVDARMDKTDGKMEAGFAMADGKMNAGFAQLSA